MDSEDSAAISFLTAVFCQQSHLSEQWSIKVVVLMEAEGKLCIDAHSGSSLVSPRKSILSFVSILGFCSLLSCCSREKSSWETEEQDTQLWHTELNKKRFPKNLVRRGAPLLWRLRQRKWHQINSKCHRKWEWTHEEGWAKQATKEQSWNGTFTFKISLKKHTWRFTDLALPVTLLLLTE